MDCTGVQQKQVQLSWAGVESAEQPQPWPVHVPGSTASQARPIASQGALDYHELQTLLMSLMHKTGLTLLRK